MFFRKKLINLDSYSYFMAGEKPVGPLEGIGSLAKNMQIIKGILNGKIVINNELWDLNIERADFVNISYDEKFEQYIARIFFSTQIVSVIFDKNLKPIMVELLNKFPYEP